ncbi:MAG TPA: 50S ribosomal protein L18 [Nitrososphaerales archaeon]|nr:50S ribosomal protein L18 [Nitrososphaerales archaeon]
MKSSYVPLLRRRREGVTDYKARMRAITSHSVLLVVRVSNKNVSSQFVVPKVSGDDIVASAHSRELVKLGWHGSLKSTPACYLLGMLAGKKALGDGIKEAVLYNGLAPFIKGGRVGALVKGVVDAGIEIPVGENAFPSQERLTGKTIAEYASKLSGESKDAYKKEFSALLKAGFNPEEYPMQFEKVRAAIMEGRK